MEIRIYISMLHTSVHIDGLVGEFLFQEWGGCGLDSWLHPTGSDVINCQMSLLSDRRSTLISYKGKNSLFHFVVAG